MTKTIEKALKHFPVVLLTGPRQCGKTELLRQHFPSYIYHSLDALDTRRLASEDPRSFLSTEGPCIIDEIQEAPELLNYVKEHVDRNSKKGQVILTGSHQFHLMKGVTESLAGRVAVLELLPFSYSEITSHFQSTLAELIWRGFFPQLQVEKDLDPELWFSSYINTYLERDLRSQIAVKDLRAFEMLLQLLAARLTQELNINKLASEIGVHAATIKAWISALEAAYVIYLLPPYFENFGKRIVKSPKLYLMDTGLVCHLTQLKSADRVLTGPLAGPLFENFVVSEYLKNFYFKGKKPAIYFWRSHDGLEVDLIVDHGLYLQPIEVKLSQTITSRHGKNLQQFQTISQKSLQDPTIVSPSTAPALPKPMVHCHWTEIASHLSV
jgi:uncharacterized protein